VQHIDTPGPIPEVPPSPPISTVATPIVEPSVPPTLAKPAVFSAPPVADISKRRVKRKPWNDVEWQKLWLATQKKPWRSLAVVAGNPGMSATPLEVATALADVGWQHLGKPISVVDARETTLGHVETRIADVAFLVAKGERVLVVLSSTFDNPATLAVARSTDACVLCVSLGKSQMTPAARTVAEIGRERFLGSVCLREATKT
jgi:hypothetical protein